ncbi:ImmA/IrrE family metallo-endopeptidase [Dactylosporangium sp. NBC_01737]|uniref:ImmA/IrrE family metallo-endopeptidase n=1 Tax=Dactylosporangium sp. NBC_01737 TaxID=2975959 RepID=UPI002E0D2D81|nr:ImmA/IrrE family metallo-endopeptidase [Dactylosporangium sp. NBC_01737]
MDGQDVEASMVGLPAALILARESRGMTQADLARAMTSLAGAAVSQGYVSKAEAGRLEVTGDRLDLYARALRYPISLLCADPELHGVGVGLVHHRKRASLGAPALRRIHAELALARKQTQGLLALAGVDGTHRFHHIAVDDFDTPADAAIAVRHEWDLAPGAVPDLVRSIEDAGGLVLQRDLGSRELDAVTQWLDGDPPLFLINSQAPPDRARFSLGHELGHVIMHREPDSGAVQERQADEFASELLLPAGAVRAELKQGRLDLARLQELKQRWGVSMAALLRRAATLNVVTDWQYRNIMVEMSALGYRTQEPSDLVRETPERVHALVADLRAQRHDVEALAEAAGLLPDEFVQLYLSGESTNTLPSR